MSVDSVGLSTTHSFSKPPTAYIYLLQDQGVQSDIHCTPQPNPQNPRQVHILPSSLLLSSNLSPGSLGENITLTLPPSSSSSSNPPALTSLPLSTRLYFGSPDSPDYTIIRLTGYRSPKKRLKEYPKGVLERCPEVKDKKGKVVGRKVGVMGVVERGGLVEPGMGVIVERPEVERKLGSV